MQIKRQNGTCKPYIITVRLSATISGVLFTYIEIHEHIPATKHSNFGQVFKHFRWC